jgi:hypothetical protein
LVHVREGSEGQNSCAEQLKARAAIHLAFDGFESADVAFYGAVAPSLGHGSFDSAYVLTQTVTLHSNPGMQLLCFQAFSGI